ncbi:Ubiquinone biosynthesis protein coq9, mitochondrial [Grifola frondosa]|uniref:Ubiquinone biosynthesis protein coq9, mitochondrial n=1 Tax=Grifola frondosa TaxID=5627 RepID=A0A1C7M559_GRIFR|nr:Ubiquinone biosynthesis protein coq9, mitochondrial [Grifola frondosa]
MSRNILLQLAIPLVKSHGFSREALSRSVLSLSTPHKEPLSETAVSALFGQGDDARRTLITAWLDDAREHMRTAPSPVMKEVLGSRLRHNEPVLKYLPEAFALLASPASGLPPLDPRPALVHASKVADEACYAVGNPGVGPSWYARRASLAAVYAAAELHQLTSPHTAYQFLEGLLDMSSRIESSFGEAEIFAKYIVRSWVGIVKSRGVF